MPFYEYQCSACSHHVEVLQKISDDPLRKCPDCGKSTMQRLISAPVFRLKGAGWYETDFKSDAEQKRNIAGREEAEAKAEDKSDAKSKEAGSGDAKAADSKAEAKSEPKAEIKTERKASPKPAKVAAPVRKPAAKAKPVKKAAAKKKAKRR